MQEDKQPASAIAEDEVGSMKLLHSEPFNILVKSAVEVEGKNHDVYHFNLPPDETGIFDVAMRLHTEPPMEESPDTKSAEPIEMKPSAPVVFEKAGLDKARAIAAKLNKLGKVEVALPVTESMR